MAIIAIFDEYRNGGTSREHHIFPMVGKDEMERCWATLERKSNLVLYEAKAFTTEETKIAIKKIDKMSKLAKIEQLKAEILRLEKAVED